MTLVAKKLLSKCRPVTSSGKESNYLLNGYWVKPCDYYREYLWRKLLSGYPNESGFLFGISYSLMSPSPYDDAPDESLSYGMVSFGDDGSF